MAKVCKFPYCGNPVFGGGYCQWHQHHRTDKKFKGLQRTPIKPISAKGRMRQEEKKKLTEKDKEFFAEIWAERKHVCFETGKDLGNEPSTLFFHHVLPKKDGPGGYPQFRYKKWNIVLLSWEAHSQAEINIDFSPKVKQYREYLLSNLSNLNDD